MNRTQANYWCLLLCQNNIFSTMSSLILHRISRQVIECGKRSYRLEPTIAKFSFSQTGTHTTQVQARTEVTSANREVIFSEGNGKSVTDSELTFEWSQLQTAYQSKRNEEILRAMFVLKICSYDTFVRNSIQVSSIEYFNSRDSRKILRSMFA